MIKVVNKEWNGKHNIFTLENDDKIFVHEWDYNNTNMIHCSEKFNKYKSIVDEHEDEIDEPIEYLGFEYLGEM